MLIEAAPALIAAVICSTRSLHLSFPDTGRLSARAPGQRPTIPVPLTGAAATEAVAVPWAIVTGSFAIVVVLLPTNSGCVWSSWVSTSAISGLVGVTGNGSTGTPAVTIARQSYGFPVSGSAGAWSVSPNVFGWA